LIEAAIQNQVRANKNLSVTDETSNSQEQLMLDWYAEACTALTTQVQQYRNPENFPLIFLRVWLVGARNSGVSKLQIVNLRRQLNTVVRASQLRKCIRSN